MKYETFVADVEQLGGVSREQAERAVQATLETLAERISGGEVEDLERELPPELHGPLERGNELSDGAARPLGLPEFVARVAEREGAPPDEAREHARAVFAVLRRAVSEDEFRDVVAQLPDDYHALLARP